MEDIIDIRLRIGLKCEKALEKVRETKGLAIDGFLIEELKKIVDIGHKMER